VFRLESLFQDDPVISLPKISPSSNKSSLILSSFLHRDLFQRPWKYDTISPELVLFYILFGQNDTAKTRALRAASLSRLLNHPSPWTDDFLKNSKKRDTASCIYACNNYYHAFLCCNIFNSLVQSCAYEGSADNHNNKSTKYPIKEPGEWHRRQIFTTVCVSEEGYRETIHSCH